MVGVKIPMLFITDHLHKFVCKSSIPVFDHGNSEENVYKLCDEIYFFHTIFSAHNLSFSLKKPSE
jgi:hypothetical protein